MSGHDFSIDCEPLTFVVAHGSLGQLDLVVEAVLRLGTATAPSPAIPCPDRAGCYTVALVARSQLGRDQLHAELHRVLSPRRPDAPELTPPGDRPSAENARSASHPSTTKEKGS
jgi:hypothetical protein